ncbi:aminopeptidase N [Paenalcaligenes hominis]|uniref:aminopeptidase N n=1 Tax=Paenalcaligenes hominis TaxID=643674 RepID=UPI0035239EBD
MTLSILRKNYTPYAYQIPHLHLHFDLDLQRTHVHSRFTVHTQTPGVALVLNGEDLHLICIRVDGHVLSDADYELNSSTLRIPLTQPSHSIEIENYCEPAQNTSLMGLYQSGSHLFTQCEAEGFRKITWFADRPDVLSRYTVHLVGDKQQFPYLLSNGNLVHSADLNSTQHEAIWEDPFAKPSYLFAVVAGDFDCREQSINTASGRNVLLQIYSDKGDYDKTEWAMQSLINALRWDEQRFGLELDLDRYMIVSAADFNMGAMENKGLNVFNAAYVLAQPQSTTDQSYRDIEAVIGHEYFHNWTGNRVTCRDWFQLSLKEGLTVFRDQEFSADMLAAGLEGAAAQSARAVKRIDDVNLLRLAQFPEDAGPMAHPIRPNSYEEISNFYTATIYEKGAEVIRMFHTLLGESGFQAALKTYFSQFDGQAVTCDDFMACMDQQYQTQFPGQSLAAFAGWYEQAGTPRLELHMHYKAASQTATLSIQQHNPPVGIELLTQPLPTKPPLLIPLTLGFLDATGTPLTVTHGKKQANEFTLQLDQNEQQFVFEQVSEAPVLSLLRDFSAPVHLDYERSINELIVLALHDDNAFSRWHAIQHLVQRCLLTDDEALNTQLQQALLQVWTQLLNDTSLSSAYLSRALNLPSVRQLLTQMRPMAPHRLIQRHRLLQQQLAQQLSSTWAALYERLVATAPTAYSPDAIEAGNRALKNLALQELIIAQHPHALTWAQAQYHSATNMTDQWGALVALVHYGPAELRQSFLDDFYAKWHQNALVLDRWFSIQANAPYFDVAQALALTQHPDFTLRNPNRARALIFQFCTNNMTQVHSPSGYDFWYSHVVALDALNPEISARLCRAFDNWSHYAEPLRSELKQRFERLQQQTQLSANVKEIVHKALTIE